VSAPARPAIIPVAILTRPNFVNFEIFIGYLLFIKVVSTNSVGDKTPK
jgi:hypothetical protein